MRETEKNKVLVSTWRCLNWDFARNMVNCVLPVHTCIQLPYYHNSSNQVICLSSRDILFLFFVG